MDEALVEAVLDAGGRAWYGGPLPSSLYDHVLRSFAINAGLTLHVRVLRGTDRHHIVEAAFKAVGLALRQALEPGLAVFSTKGSVIVERGEEVGCFESVS
jgi:imidazoleglycerol-phosphate dehydratase